MVAFLHGDWGLIRSPRQPTLQSEKLFRLPQLLMCDDRTNQRGYPHQRLQGNVQRPPNFRTRLLTKGEYRRPSNQGYSNGPYQRSLHNPHYSDARGVTYYDHHPNYLPLRPFRPPYASPGYYPAQNHEFNYGPDAIMYSKENHYYYPEKNGVNFRAQSPDVTQLTKRVAKVDININKFSEAGKENVRDESASPVQQHRHSLPTVEVDKAKQTNIEDEKLNSSQNSNGLHQIITSSGPRNERRGSNSSARTDPGPQTSNQTEKQSFRSADCNINAPSLPPGRSPVDNFSNPPSLPYAALSDPYDNISVPSGYNHPAKNDSFETIFGT